MSRALPRFALRTSLFALAVAATSAVTAPLAAQGPAIGLWKKGTPAVGMFVPSERPFNATDANGNRLPPLYTAEGAKALNDSPLLDFLFLNLEGAYDVEAVKTLVAAGKARGNAPRPTLIVRIPTIEAAGEEATRARVKEVLALGADGVTIPHVRSAAEAKVAAGFFKDAGAKVWSKANPNGTIIAMLMIEDKGAVAELEAIAAVPGYSLLSCGIGSLGQNMGGDRAGAEVACKNVRDAGMKQGMPSMMTANAATTPDRLEKGYLGLLYQGTLVQVTPMLEAARAASKR